MEAAPAAAPLLPLRVLELPSLLAIRWFDPRGPDGRWHGCDEVIFALSGLACDGTAAERARQAAAIEAAIAERVRGRPAAQAAAGLLGAGVPAAPVLPARALGTDPQLTATGVGQIMEREYAGRHSVGAAAVRF